jgi:hypothetical protein
MFSNKVEFTPHQSKGCCDEGWPLDSQLPCCRASLTSPAPLLWARHS